MYRGVYLNVIVMRFVVTVNSDINFKLQNKFPFCSTSAGFAMLDAYYVYFAF